MSAVLYVVGTPIGNLGDLSPRAIDAFENCDFIAAEDTRVTLKLLNSFGIRARTDRIRNGDGDIRHALRKIHF